MENKSTLKERLEEFVEYLDLTNQKFEQNAGLPNGFINKSGKYISDKSEQKIINTYPDLNINWLLTGEGEMLNNGQKHLSQQTEPQINENSLDELYLLNKTIDILRENLERKDAQIESLFAIIRQFQNSL